MSKVRTCCVCGKQYEYCPHCSAYNADEKWRFIYCSNDCRMIDAICKWYRFGKISEKEAQEKLSTYTIPSNIIDDQLTTDIIAIRALNKIGKEVAEEIKAEEPAIKTSPIIESVSVSEEIPMVEEPVAEKHEYKSRKKKIVNEVIE